MSRVEENAQVRKDISEAMEDVMKTVEGMDGVARVTLLNSAKMTTACAYLEDISRSQAVIADSLSYILKEEAQVRKERAKKWKDKVMPSYLPTNPYLRDMESRFKAFGITSEEWETWVGLRDKYLYGKKESEE